MSPEAKAAAAILAILRSEIGADVAGMRKQAGELQALAATWQQVRGERPLVVVAAVSVHAWYTALETLLERIARALDGRLPEGPRSHVELLTQMAVELPGLRPAVLRSESIAELRELLKFRHFFRNAYNVELDVARLERQVRRLLAMEPVVEQALDAFGAFLDASMRELAKA